MNRNELIHVVVGQYVLLLIVALVAAFFGLREALSAFCGGLCVAIPNTVFALVLMRSLDKGAAVNPLSLLLGEVIKLLTVCLLILMLVKLWPNLSWPAMLVAIGAVALSNLSLVFYKH